MTLILGIGNLLMGDEGVGVHAINRLESEYRDRLPSGVRLLDGGVAGFHLLGEIEEADRLVIIDATMDGRPPGTIDRIRPRFSSDYPRTLSAHDIGLKDLLDVLYLSQKRVPDVTLYTVSVEFLPESLTTALSESVSASLHALCEKVLVEAG